MSPWCGRRPTTASAGSSSPLIRRGSPLRRSSTRGHCAPRSPPNSSWTPSGCPPPRCGPRACLAEARFGIVWGALGAARSCYETALEYAKTRLQFGAPIAAYQLTQEKLANMAVELAKGQLLALHFGRLKDQGRLAPEHVSIAKLNSTREALEICRTARTILGGNGISYEFPIMRHMANLESVLTYEGTPEMHILVIGQALTGHSAFRG